MNPNYLDFEQPIAELQAKIEELRLVGNDSRISLSDEIGKLEEKSRKLTEQIFRDLTAWQVTQLSRHPQRPYTLDYLDSIFTDFDEMHGEHFDRVAIRIKHRDPLYVVVERDGAISPGNQLAWQGAHQMQMALRRQSSGPVDAHHGHTH